ncbi:MAG: 5-formyltetrahydrofolate cyclo-ligase [Oscillospiraceae bacterium]|nr:5-formyltetrahydrofolate cyclo-ligase [Oscillospiraceae bacterium]
MIRHLECYGKKMKIFCYCSTPAEPDTWEIINFCLANGFPLSVPFCKNDSSMKARCIQSREELTPGLFGILEPPKNAPIMRNPEIIIVPGLAFDRQGYRIGKGRGYYDRYLRYTWGVSIGLCFHDFLLPSIPRDGWDVPVDFVVTRNGLFESER